MVHSYIVLYTVSGPYNKIVQNLGRLIDDHTTCIVAYGKKILVITIKVSVI